MEVLESVLCTIANDPVRKKNYILRGSMLYRQRIDKARKVKDMDIFIDASYFDKNNFGNLENLLNEVNSVITLTNERVIDKKIEIIGIFSE